jgi:YidC/Oxa1 family membrane protein insertase
MNMDRKTVIAVALCLVVLIAYPFLLKTFGLDRYLRPAEPPRSAAVDSLARDSSGVLPPPGVTPASPRAASPSAASSPASALAGGSNAQLSATPFATPSSELERSVHIETPLYRAEFSSRGARLLSFELKHYASAHGAWTSDPTAKRPKPGKIVPSEDRVALAASPAFGVDLGSGPGLRSLGNVVYAVAESLDAAGETRVLTFTARDSAGMAVQQTWRVRADDYALDLEVSVRGVPAGLHVSDYSLTSRSWPLVYEANSQDESRSLQATSLVGDNLHREGPGGLRKGEKRFEGNVVWAVVNTRYFLGGVAPVRGAARAAVASTESRTLTAAQLRVLPAGTRPEQDIAVSALVMALPGESESSHHFLVYFGPKEYFRLIKLGSHWERVVDLGWSWIVPVKTPRDAASVTGRSSTNNQSVMSTGRCSQTA